MRFALTLTLLVLAASNITLSDDWPQWRGPDRTDISQETGLLKNWPTGGPKQIWKSTDAGLGYSGFSIADGRVFTMGAGDREFVVALSESDGRTLWSTGIADRLSNGWGDGPRSTPTIDGDRVYALSGTGTLACLKAESGEIVWSVSMSEFGGKKPNWGLLRIRSCR